MARAPGGPREPYHAAKLAESLMQLYPDQIVFFRPEPMKGLFHIERMRVVIRSPASLAANDPAI